MLIPCAGNGSLVPAKISARMQLLICIASLFVRAGPIFFVTSNRAGSIWFNDINDLTVVFCWGI